ncbi:hypothetical protein CMI47_02360 [Candidatus Pacearchaeota archaeon]|nr:hypothetical protein [Candidatus Pacearchaeota archaeon]
MAIEYNVNTDFAGVLTPGTTNSLFLKITDFNGDPKNVYDVSISIVDVLNSAEKSGTPEKIQSGYYVFEWEMGDDLDAGVYTATWSYTDENDDDFTSVQEIVVSDDGDDSSIYTGMINDLRVALEFHIRSAMNIPVYQEQSKPSVDSRVYSFNFPRWNQTAGVRIYRNQELINEGYEINYFKGNVTFDESLTDFDIVNADYNFRWFDDAQLIRFLQNALDQINYYPPASRYSLAGVPMRYVAGVLYGASRDALRELMMSLMFQETQQIFGGGEKATNLFSNFETLKKNYEEDFTKMLDAKKFGPYVGLTKAIVTPEYTLPGGRSRYFRYLFSGSS